MDPDANVREQESILTTSENVTPRLRELRTALWDWVCRGGFQPSKITWEACPLARKYYARTLP